MERFQQGGELGAFLVRFHRCARGFVVFVRNASENCEKTEKSARKLVEKVTEDGKVSTKRRIGCISCDFTGVHFVVFVMTLSRAGGIS